LHALGAAAEQLEVNTPPQENAQLSSPMSGDGLGDVGGPLSPRSAGLGSRHSGIALGSGSTGSSTGGGGGAYRRVGQTDDKEKAPLRAGGGFDKASNGGQLYSTFPDLTEKETRHVEQSVDVRPCPPPQDDGGKVAVAHVWLVA
jgi:hypothetical protein